MNSKTSRVVVTPQASTHSNRQGAQRVGTTTITGVYRLRSCVVHLTRWQPELVVSIRTPCLWATTWDDGNGNSTTMRTCEVCSPTEDTLHTDKSLTERATRCFIANDSSPLSHIRARLVTLAPLQERFAIVKPLLKCQTFSKTHLLVAKCPMDSSSSRALCTKVTVVSSGTMVTQLM